jgi:5'-3' exonuclease
MGIKNFSKLFRFKTIRFKDMANQAAMIDAPIILHKAATGAARLDTLTDSEGHPTIHINVILAKALNFKKNKTAQLWVFDYHEKGYVPPHKAAEIATRQARRTTAQKKLDSMQHRMKLNQPELFSSDDDDNSCIGSKSDTNSCIGSKSDTNSIKKNSLAKQAFSMTGAMVNDCKFILDCLGIQWIDAPKGIEAEHVCADLTRRGIGDFVFSTDTDALIYGAKALVRDVRVKQKKVIQRLDLADALQIAKIDMSGLRRIAVMLGCDHAPKTPRVGPKTVLKKYKDATLTPAQKAAIKVFEGSVPALVGVGRPTLNVVNDAKKINQLLDWLVSRNFSRDRVAKQIRKVFPLI